MFSLGFMFAESGRAPRDPVQAHMWYDLAAAHGSADAAHKRDQLARQMSAAEIAEARRLAADWESHEDRKSVVKGKSVSVRVDLGGGRIIKNKKRGETN